MSVNGREIKGPELDDRPRRANTLRVVGLKRTATRHRATPIYLPSYVQLAHAKRTLMEHSNFTQCELLQRSKIRLNYPEE